MQSGGADTKPSVVMKATSWADLRLGDRLVFGKCSLAEIVQFPPP